MRRIKRIPVFLLAGALLLSEAVYAAPETGAPAEEVAAELLRLEPREEAEVPVSVVDENGEAIPEAPASVSVGVCSEVKPELEGYDYVRATAGGDEIYAVGSFEDTLYYVPKEDTSTGLLLDGREIVLHYERHVETYEITYSTVLSYSGPETVEEGQSYSFTAAPDGKGKELAVTVNGTDISARGVLEDSGSGLTRYTVEDVREPQFVTITEMDVSGYVFSYEQKDILNGYISFPESGTSVQPGDALVFYLNSSEGEGWDYEAGRFRQWHLNGLEINGESVQVPSSYGTPYNPEEWKDIHAESVLSSGERVMVQLTKCWHDQGTPNRYKYEYTVTIENVYTDITVTGGNFKSSARDEIILKQLDGVDEIMGWDYAGESFKKGSLNQVYLQTGQWGNEFYFNLLTGYTNPEVTVLAGGVAHPEIQVWNVKDLEEVSLEGYQYQFNITDGLSDNVEVYISAEKKQYTVKYMIGEEEADVADEGTYTIFPEDSHETRIGGVPAYDRDKYIFEGWEYGGRVYQPDEVFRFTGDTTAGADENGVIRFTAKLIPIESSRYVPYTVQYWFQKEAGSDSYERNEKEYDDIKGYGIRGTTLFWYRVLSSSGRISGYVVDISRSDIRFELGSGPENILKIYFKVDSNHNGQPDEEEAWDPGGDSRPDSPDSGTGGDGSGDGDGLGGGDSLAEDSQEGGAPESGSVSVPAEQKNVKEILKEEILEEAETGETGAPGGTSDEITDSYVLAEVGSDSAPEEKRDKGEEAEIDDDETPLAGQQVQSRRCDFHRGILLAALVVSLLFILDGFRRKRKIRKLKEELEIRKGE